MEATPVDPSGLDLPELCSKATGGVIIVTSLHMFKGHELRLWRDHGSKAT